MQLRPKLTSSTHFPIDFSMLGNFRHKLFAYIDRVIFSIKRIIFSYTVVSNFDILSRHYTALLSAEFDNSD